MEIDSDDRKMTNGQKPMDHITKNCPALSAAVEIARVQLKKKATAQNNNTNKPNDTKRNE